MSSLQRLVGTTIAQRYRIERPIGEGGMGAVFEAVQLSLGRRIAIKVVKPSFEGDAEIVKRFERETEAIARLNHPHIVHVIDAGLTEDGTLFLAMELLPGLNIRQVLRREGPFALPRALRIVEEVSSALVAAHEAGVIHRDLKAENIVLLHHAGRGEVAKVLDFGVAKLTSQTEAPPMTGSGFVAGTPGFISPEQMLGRTDDPRSDLYSMGVLLFEMLTGRGPFVAQNAMELMLRHLTEPAPLVSEVAREIGVTTIIPAAIDDVVAMLLRKEPEGRPASALALVHIMRSLRDSSTATLPDVARPVASPSQTALAQAATQVVAKAEAAPLPPNASSPFSEAPATHTPVRPPAPLAASAARVATSVIAPPPASAPAAVSPAAALASPAASSAWTPGPAGASAAASAASASAPAVAVTITAPTGSVPLPQVAAAVTAPATRVVRRGSPRAIGAAALAVVVLSLAGVWFFVRASSQLHTSFDPLTNQTILRATDAYWRLDTEAAARDLAFAIDKDAGAALAFLLQAHVATVERAPLTRVDVPAMEARRIAERADFPDPRTAAFITAVTDLDNAAVKSRFDQYVRTYPAGPLERQLFAMRLSTDGTPEEREARFRAVTTDGPMQPATSLGLADALLDEGRTEDAVAVLDAALARNPATPALVDARVDNDLARGDVQQAIARLRALTAAAPNNVDAAVRLAALLADGGAHETFDALVQRQKQAEVSARRVDGLAKAGEALAALGRFNDADALWREAHRTADRPARAAEIAAYAVFFAVAVERYDAAAQWSELLKESLYAVDPMDAAARRERVLAKGGDALRALAAGDTAGAARTVAQLSSEPIDLPIVLSSIGWRVHAQAGEAARAQELLLRLPPCFRAHDTGLYFSGIGDTARAAAAFDEAIARGNACLRGSRTLTWLERVLYADALSRRIAGALAAHDDATHAPLLASFNRSWARADRDLAAVKRTRTP